jgi:hypothetical protein
VACRALSISRSGFYDWLGRPEPPRELRNREVMKLITQIHAESRGSYGSPRVHAELRLGIPAPRAVRSRAEGGGGGRRRARCFAAALAVLLTGSRVVRSVQAT